MQKIIFFFVVLFAFTACKKDNDVVPADSAAAVAGTYAMSRFAVDAPGTTDDFDDKYPETINGITYGGEVTLTQNANSTDRVDLLVELKETGEDDFELITADNVEVRRNGSNYDLYLGTTQIGTATGSKITLDATEQGTRYIVEASR